MEIVHVTLDIFQNVACVSIYVQIKTLHGNRIVQYFQNYICGALRDLVTFVQFKKREKQQWRSVSFSKACLSTIFSRFFSHCNLNV